MPIIFSLSPKIVIRPPSISIPIPKLHNNVKTAVPNAKLNIALRITPESFRSWLIIMRKRITLKSNELSKKNLSKDLYE